MRHLVGGYVRYIHVSPHIIIIISAWYPLIDKERLGFKRALS